MKQGYEMRNLLLFTFRLFSFSFFFLFFTYPVIFWAELGSLHQDKSDNINQAVRLEVDFYLTFL